MGFIKFVLKWNAQLKSFHLLPKNEIEMILISILFFAMKSRYLVMVTNAIVKIVIDKLNKLRKCILKKNVVYWKCSTMNFIVPLFFLCAYKWTWNNKHLIQSTNMSLKIFLNKCIKDILAPLLKRITKKLIFFVICNYDFTAASFILNKSTSRSEKLAFSIRSIFRFNINSLFCIAERFIFFPINFKNWTQ